jgi:hypothetical protein
MSMKRNSSLSTKLASPPRSISLPVAEATGLRSGGSERAAWKACRGTQNIFSSSCSSWTENIPISYSELIEIGEMEFGTASRMTVPPPVRFSTVSCPPRTAIIVPCSASPWPGISFEAETV